MPFQASPFVGVPGFLHTGAQAPDPRMAAAMEAMQGVSPPVESQMTPPGAAGAAGAPGMDPQELDLFDRVAQLITKHPQLWLPIFAGMGMSKALEKTGKFVSKPHRSNEELGSQGYGTGQPGQTGMASPDQMLRSVQPPAMGGMTGF